MAKHLKKHADGSAHGYTNDANPFNDTNVSERFVWGKKIEKQLREGADVREMTSKAERVRQEDRLVRLQHAPLMPGRLSFACQVLGISSVPAEPACCPVRGR